MSPLTRTPTSMVVNGAYLRVRDPDASAGDLFADYITMPGLGSFTMPAETGGVTETVTIDGPISAPQFKGVGTITGAIAGLTRDVTHQFLEQRSIDGREIQLAIDLPARSVTEFVIEGGSNVEAVDTDYDRIVAASIPDAVSTAILRGHFMALGAVSGAAVYPDGTVAVLGYDATAAAIGWRAVIAADQDSKVFNVSPDFGATDISVALNMERGVRVRNPGVSWLDISCVVSQFDLGDFQAGGNVSSNFTFVPARAVPSGSVNLKTDSELGFTK